MASVATRTRIPVFAQDVLLALVVAILQIAATIRASSGQVAVRPLEEPGYLGYALLAAGGLVLVARRRQPVAVYAATVALNCAYYLIGYPDGAATFSVFVAIYTLTAYGDGRRSIVIAGAGKAVLLPVWLLTATYTPPAAVGWLLFRISTTLMAGAFGESIRARDVLAAEAHERARRAEQTKEEEARRRVDAERLRIAREVHDTVAHAIAVINVQAGVSAHVLDKRPEQARDALGVIEETSARAGRELRATLGVLRAAEEDARAPAPGLAQVDELAGIAREAGLDVKVEAAVAGGHDLPSAVGSAAYRIVQESLTNVIRHAGPARVTVSMGCGPDGLEVVVTDDGPGAPATNGTGGADGGAGQGINGMRERAELLGGELTAGPRPSGGFEVRARIPLPPAPAASPS
jgi:signal transduction histidine kinase